jgi:hypothetical protein
MTQDERQDLYAELMTNYVTTHFDKRVLGPYTYNNCNYYFGNYRILFRLRKPEFKEIKHGEVFVFKKNSMHEYLPLIHWDGTSKDTKYVYDMYIDTKNKLKSERLSRIKSEKMLIKG